MADAQDVWLGSDSLCSKWGFWDGDEPEWIWDYCRKSGIDWSAVDWHVVLRRLVRAYLLPTLAEHHEVEVYDIDTSHNPIRASMIDGRDVDDYQTGEPLTPDGVLVPAEAVVAEIRAVLDTPG